MLLLLQSPDITVASVASSTHCKVVPLFGHCESEKVGQLDISKYHSSLNLMNTPWPVLT